MNSSIELRKVIGGVVLTVLWVCTFLFIQSTLVIDWVGDGSVTTNFKFVVVLIGLLIIILYHIFYRASLTTALTICWLALIIFYPFKDPANDAGGAVAFFALIGGLGIVVLWVRFFSDDIVVSQS